jgi:AraC family transcriptional activator of pobA
VQRLAPHAAPPLDRIPTFGLYGTEAEPGLAAYAHIERIASRAPAHGWRIATHRHADLSQLLIVTAGGGMLTVDGTAHAIAPPWFVWLPAGVVHGFGFEADTDGLVLTLSADTVGAAVAASTDRAALSGLVAEPMLGPMPAAEEIGVDVAAVMQAIECEQATPRTGAHTVLTGNLMLLMVAMQRTRSQRNLDRQLGETQASEFRRFRAFVERNFRKASGVAEIARALGLSPNRLHAVAMRAVGRGPLAVLHDRIMLEAKRELMFTDKPVAEIAFDCGFEDPAHFSRFFTQRAGASPRAFRKAAARGA